MGLSAAADVRFDYVASLQLARRLWALGDEVDELMANRVRGARTALTDWLGRYGTQFADRIDSESQQATAIANDLRAAAEQWAVRWAEAMNEQNRILHARESKRVEDDRNIVEDVVGGLFGHHDLPPDPPGIEVPTSPNFYATGSLTRY
jgi:hypothetical protein